MRDRESARLLRSFAHIQVITPTLNTTNSGDSLVNLTEPTPPPPPLGVRDDFDRMCTFAPFHTDHLKFRFEVAANTFLIGCDKYESVQYCEELYEVASLALRGHCRF